MPGKILSSREEDTSVETLQQLLFVVKDALGRENEPIPERIDEVLLELDHDVLDLVIDFSDLEDSNSDMIGELVSLSVSNAELSSELNRAAKVLAALASPPTQEDILDRAVNSIQHDCELTPVFGVYQFSEEMLKEALRTAIMNYNIDVGNRLLDS